MKVVGISGSLRKGSYNTALLRAAKELLPEGSTLDIVSIAAVPMYDDDDLRLHGFPAPVQQVRKHIAAADAVVIATPEYNFSISGVLKNTLDWVSRREGAEHQPLDGKPVAIMGVATGGFGTVRAQMHLRDILVHLNCHVVNKPQVLVMHAREKFDADLHLTDEPTRDFVRDLLKELAVLTAKIKSEQATV